MALKHYMTDPLTPGINEGLPNKFVQFKVFAKVVPSHKDGKRFVYRRDLAKIASFIETDLEEAALFTLANPVAFTPQVGQRPARVTIFGFLELDRTTSPNENPTTYPSLIHSGTDPGQSTSVVRGPTGGSTSWGQDVKARIDEEVKWLKSALEAASPWLDAIFFIEYDGVKYGPGYRSFNVPH